MAGNYGEESSSLPPNEKPVVVRVKRKAFQSPLDALWLEINERPSKRPLLDFGKLSISETSGKVEAKTKKVLVRRVETVSSSEACLNIVLSRVPDLDIEVEHKFKIEERRNSYKKENQNQDKLLERRRREQEVLAKSARFEQIWRSRRGNKESDVDEELHEACRLYDIVRVDVGETSIEAQHNSQVKEETTAEDHMMMSGFLPLLREFLPNAAEEVEHDIYSYLSGKESKEEYVYDVYTVKDDMDITNEEASNPFPLVQVNDDDEYYDGPDNHEYETDDSNAEDNPRNDYPEEVSEDESEDSDYEPENDETETSDDESEKDESETDSDRFSEVKDVDSDFSGGSDPFYDDVLYDIDDTRDYRDDDGLSS